jgi:hypothetical protein
MTAGLLAVLAGITALLVAATITAFVVLDRPAPGASTPRNDAPDAATTRSDQPK